MQWLTEVPRAVVHAHLVMLPRLEADESLAAVQRTAAGSGAMKQGAQRELVQAWARLAKGEAGHGAGRPAPSPAALAGIGIGVRRRSKP
jgi:hypothetical protein